MLAKIKIFTFFFESKQHPYNNQLVDSDSLFFMKVLTLNSQISLLWLDAYESVSMSLNTIVKGETLLLKNKTMSCQHIWPDPGAKTTIFSQTQPSRFLYLNLTKL